MKLLLLLTALFLISYSSFSQEKEKKIPFDRYISSRAPLRQNPYIELPLGAITPNGWLREMLLRQKSGSTGQLDILYPLVMGSRNGWLGGDGDQWERGPYWIDGLVPLAYILNDKELIAKAKPWIEWTLNSQQPDGYFGPSKDYAYERGVQRDNSHDWWPKMVMLKVLKQYYSATGDQRVIKLLTNYFRFQLNELPRTPLDHWTFWARYRGGDNLQVVLWLYNITGDKFLLDLADIIHKQTFNYTDSFLNTDMLSRQGSIHCVNLAQGFKEPLVYYQKAAEQKYVDATNKGLADLRKYDGMAHGMYGADEALHGNNPTQGSEFCSSVEMMFSLETMLAITGDVSYADKLERIAFNALPTQATDDFMARQYFQQANQVMISRQQRNFDQNHGGTDVCYGLLTGYPCCTSNMHQGWPKFTQNLWYATPAKGLAALLYAPSRVKAYVGDGTEVVMNEETNYPFDEQIRISLSIPGKSRSVSFPLQLRIPQWCNRALVKINAETYKETAGNTIITINRQWKDGDMVELSLPMHILRNNWFENSVSVERGPLVYALKIDEEWKKVTNEKDPVEYGSSYYEVTPTSPWNYGLVYVPANKLDSAFSIEKKPLPAYPWNLESAPIIMTAAAKRIPSWTIYNGMTGPIPWSITSGMETAAAVEKVVLIPYGCTTLRISQFPQVRNR